MKLDQAVKNIDTVLQNARMTRPEHIELDSNLKFLVARAKLADKLEQEQENAKGQTEVEEVPDGTVTRVE
jgi:hypothetical protein